MSILAVFHLFPIADRSVNQADRTAQANNLARTLMEDTLAKDYTALSTNPADYVEGELLVEHTQRRGASLKTWFKYKIEVTEPDPAKKLKNILVTVNWTRGSDQPMSTSLESVKGRFW